MKLSIFPLFFLCAAAVGQPITPSPAAALESKVVSDLLASQDSAQAAWAAHLAGNYRFPAFSSDLLRLATSSDWRVRMAATESLVRLNVDVPEQILTKMAEDRLDEVLIFIARKQTRSIQPLDRRPPRPQDRRSLLGGVEQYSASS